MLPLTPTLLKSERGAIAQAHPSDHHTPHHSTHEPHHTSHYCRAMAEYSPNGRTRPVGTKKMSNASPLSLLELICMSKWQKAREYIDTHPESVYECFGTNRRLAIHEICKLVACPDAPNMTGEVSDDEDEEEGVPSAPCLECAIEDNRQLCELAQLMIDVASGLGQVKLAAVPLDQTENEGQVVDQVEEEGRFELFDSILTVTDSMGKTPLHILCEQSADTNMMKTILESTREHSKSPKAPTAAALLSARDSRGSTPLHYLAYSRQCPFSSLEVMMDHAKPTASSTTSPSGEEVIGVTDVSLCCDNDGDTPLHWALDGYMSARRVKQLIRYSKAALFVKNAAGKLPFDQFVGNFVDNDWAQHELCGREAWDNIEGYLKVVTDHDEASKPEEWLPVHALASAPINFPEVFTDIALHFNKEDLSKPNSKGHLPLHAACARTDSATQEPEFQKMAIKLLRIYPQAAYKPAGGTKRLPIHIAIESKKPLPFVAALLKAYPNSLNIKDPRTGLWPFLLAGSCYGEQVDLSYGLLRADPSVVQVAIRALISKSGQRAAQARRDMEANEYGNDHSSRRTRRFIRRDD